MRCRLDNYNKPSTTLVLRYVRAAASTCPTYICKSLVLPGKDPQHTKSPHLTPPSIFTRHIRFCTPKTGIPPLSLVGGRVVVYRYIWPDGRMQRLGQGFRLDLRCRVCCVVLVGRGREGECVGEEEGFGGCSCADVQLAAGFICMSATSSPQVV